MNECRIKYSPLLPHSQWSSGRWVSALREWSQWLASGKMPPDVRALELEHNRVPLPRSILMINGLICQHNAENQVSDKSSKGKPSSRNQGKMAQARGKHSGGSFWLSQSGATSCLFIQTFLYVKYNNSLHVHSPMPGMIELDSCIMLPRLGHQEFSC